MTIALGPFAANWGHGLGAVVPCPVDIHVPLAAYRFLPRAIMTTMPEATMNVQAADLIGWALLRASSGRRPVLLYGGSRVEASATAEGLESRATTSNGTDKSGAGGATVRLLPAKEQGDGSAHL